MLRRISKSVLGGALFSLLALLFFPDPAAAGAEMKGNVIGFIYAQDGTTPMEGAIVKFKNLTSGEIFESSRSDVYGVFKVQGIAAGVYAYGVVTEKGDFNADDILGLKINEKETAKLSIALNPYDQDTAAAIAEVAKGQEKSGEFLVGLIAGYDAQTGLAQVQIANGLLRLNDRIHIKGKSTDFYQEIPLLRMGSSPVQKVKSGQTATLRMERNALKGDLVYVVSNKKIFPLFLAPLGVAAVLGANSAVTYGIFKIMDQAKPVSAIR
jgi:hypothetical protein